MHLGDLKLLEVVDMLKLAAVYNCLSGKGERGRKEARRLDGVRNIL